MARLTNLYENATIDPIGRPCMYCAVAITDTDQRVTVAASAYAHEAAHTRCHDRATQPAQCSRIGCTATEELTQHQRTVGTGVTDHWALCPRHEEAHANPPAWCSVAGCTKPYAHTGRCPGANDCPSCECCTAETCAAKTWNQPGVPQGIVKAFNLACPCERRG